ncbi:MAG: peptide deformylase [Patescibacteria group bacterium]
MVRKIVTAKAASLRQESKKVGKIDKKVKDLIADMKQTLSVQKDPEGVGLAAPQIGKNFRIFLVNYDGLEKVIINPEILEISKDGQPKPKTKSGKKKKGEDLLEGCLSLPHYYGPLKRSTKIKIKYLDEKGQEVVEEFKDFFAQIIQHEIDHLNGILFIDRIIEQNSPLYKFHKDGDWEKVELV